MDSPGGKPKVFGLGYMKTGTSTLGSCFRALGYLHHPYAPKLIRQMRRGDLQSLWEVVDDYDTFEDHPWPDLFRQLDDRYPDAKFVLTVRRDSGVWFRSLAGHAKRRGPTAEKYILFGHGWPQRDPDRLIKQYEVHNRAVQEHFSGRPDKLLVVCWETGSEWKDVATFLGHDAASTALTTVARNAGSEQRIQPRAWLRNTIKYVLIGRLHIDPFLQRTP